MTPTLMTALLGHLRRDERALNQRAPRDDHDVCPLASLRRPAKRNHVVGARIGRLVVRLTVQVLVLEEHDRIVAADRRAQQAGGVLCGRRKCDAKSGAVREDALAGLAVIHAAAAQISADGDADDDRRLEGVGRPVPQHRELVANLHHRRPDVVEELNLDDRLDAAHRHANRAPDDVRLGERRIEDAVVSERALEAVRGLEHAALARYLFDDVAVARIGDVLAEHDHQRIARHLVVQRAIDRGDHRNRDRPEATAGVSNRSDVGSTSGEYT